MDFKNTIIILTSNLGSPIILEGIGEDGELRQEARDEVNALLKRQFRPEFLNRLDETVFYKPLTKKNIGAIVDLLMADLDKRLSEHQLHITLTEAAKAFIIEEGYDPTFGARPLRRFLQSRVETLVARRIIGGALNPGDTLTVDVEDDRLVIREPAVR